MDYPEWLAVIRFFHIISGILWIGLLYFFNFVQVPAYAKMEAPARMQALLNVTDRALFFFRWAALATVVFGLIYIGVREAQFDDVGYFEEPAGKSILVGGAIGIIMFLNVWGIIWPNQKKVLAATRATVASGTPAPADQPRWARRAFLASRTNTMLSIPMLFFMVAARNLPDLW